LAASPCCGDAAQVNARPDEYSVCAHATIETAKKLLKAEKLVAVRMLAMLEYAAAHPKRWHNIGPLGEDSKAAELLEKRGVIETRQPMNQYRFKPQN
jgi:hypothetical protein